MSQELAVREAPGQVITTADVMLSREQMAILKATICKDANDQELLFFAHVCKSKQMDPFSGEIHLVKRDGKPVIQTGIDGFRAQAERSGHYAGSDEPQYEENADGTRPTKCSVTVYKIVCGVRVAFTATIRWEEFYPGDKQGFMWRAKPFHMLGKCAEAQALRKAFPRQLAGLHIPEEMDSAMSAPVEAAAAKTATVSDALKTKARPVQATIVVDLTERRQKALGAFEKLGQGTAQVLAHLKIATVGEITEDHMNGELAVWYDELKQEQEGQAQ